MTQCPYAIICKKATPTVRTFFSNTCKKNLLCSSHSEQVFVTWVCFIDEKVETLCTVLMKKLNWLDTQSCFNVEQFSFEKPFSKETNKILWASNHYKAQLFNLRIILLHTFLSVIRYYNKFESQIRNFNCQKTNGRQSHHFRNKLLYKSPKQLSFYWQKNPFDWRFF